MAAGESLSRGVPDAAIFSFEVWRPQALLDPLLDPAMTERVEALPVWPAFSASPQFRQLTDGVRFIEMAIDADWRKATRELTAGGMLFAAAPGERAVLLVATENEERLRKLHEIAGQITRSEARKAGREDPVRAEEIDGLTRWTFNGKEAHTIVDGRLVAASDPATLDAVLRTMKAGEAGTLAASAPYRAACAAVGDEAVAMAYVNLRVLRSAPAVAQALAGSNENPLAALLVAGLATGLKQADWLAVGFYIEGRALVARTVLGPGSGPADGPASVVLPPAGRAGALPNFAVPGQIAALSLFRDLHRFYAAKDELFPARTSGLIFFENMMGIFFTGRDLTDEVLARLGPEIRLVVARQDYPAAAGAPEPELPGFALVLPLKDREFKLILEEAWQKALGLVNFTRGQKAEPGLILDRPQHRGLTMTVARFSTAGLAPEDRGDTRFNFQPTLAMPADFAILSSSESLARKLVDAVQAGPATGLPLGGSHTALQLDGGRLAEVLRANHEPMVRGNMLKEGHTRAEAELAIDTLLALVGQVRQASLTLQGGNGPSEASLRIEFTR
ncbi:MAG: hypothetical protein H7A45_11135 [Verrucomicrobiales bacterium]|nr:hypothetical protein [Verrucomicrobiales bacterium]MCP5526886.1 hypothetical protein [Verrucomicrobiales bacterium]